MPSVREVNGMNIVSQNDRAFNGESRETFLGLRRRILCGELTARAPNGLRSLAAPTSLPSARVERSARVSVHAPGAGMGAGQVSVAL